MLTDQSNLLLVWAISISWSAFFLLAVSSYLYVNRKHRLADAQSVQVRLSDFVFVIVLGALLVLYIVSITRTSSLIFAVGNIIVEITLIVYTLRSKSEERQRVVR